MRIDQLFETSGPDGNAVLLDYFRRKPFPDDLLDSEWMDDIWRHYAASGLNDPEASYWDLDAAGQRAFADWFEREGFARELLHDDPHAAPAWTLMEPVRDALLPRTTWLLHFCQNASKIKQEGFRFGVPDLDRIALTRQHDVFGNVKRLRYPQPGYNFAFMADGSIRLTQRWNPEGYGKQMLLFQSGGVLVHHDGDREEQVVFWGPSADLGAAVVIKATARDFAAEDGTRSPSLDDLIKTLIAARSR